METLGKRLKFSRELRSVTAQWLADRIGVTRGAVTNWELGSAKPDRENVRKACDALEIDLHWLEIGIGPAPTMGRPSAIVKSEIDDLVDIYSDIDDEGLRRLAREQLKTIRDNQPKPPK